MKKLLFLFGFIFCFGIVRSFGQASEEDIAKANNPLADITAINFQNYYSPNLESIPDQSSNTFNLRFVKPIGKVLVRATLPLVTTPSGTGSGTAGMVKSGLGDFNIFASYTFVSKPDLILGAGPMVVAPTASEDALGVDPWQLGLAFIAYKIASPTLQYGGLVTYQHSVWKDDDEMDNDLIAVQPFAMFQLGKGTYLRSTGIMSFSPERGTYNIPMGLGIGKVVKASGTVFNLYLEPQYSILHHSVGQAQYQILAGINLQFSSKK